MGTTTQVFAGNAAIAYAAFNLRDPYYPEMARFVIEAAKSRLNSTLVTLGTVVDLGAGIGMSTMELLKEPSVERVIAVEPEAGMRYFCELNTMGDPRARVIEGRGENLSDVITPQLVGHDITLEREWKLDAVLCCQVFHLFNPPGQECLVPKVFAEVARVLQRSGVFAFDLGPSNFEFATPLSDHRASRASGRGIIRRGEILTEFAHPLYQQAHAIAYDVVKREFSDFERENLWPPAAARMSFDFLRDACEQAGLHDLAVREDFSPVSGRRVINFLRNGWHVWFRWPPLSDLPAERKIALIGEVMNELFRQPDFEAMGSVMSYHPTAVFTAMR